ncbi:MAG TPA: recombinase family protein [Pseudonocardia sp.]|uniref:recombinase family protein n=1 Tax=Pseudonocardia sp. TaxID=60912 RepID=UPI002C5FC684|nr:recombinase family protein [Pseudonocardia sp.]HTF52210.1 recombinase family protein [Pseudonocardia sp.]
MTSTNSRTARPARRKLSTSYSYVPDWAEEHNAAMPADAPIIDLYARLSKNRYGKLEKIEDQIDAGRYEVLVPRRWRIGMVHVDNSLSAWNKNVRRPAWEHLLDRLGSRAAAGAGVYHQDRLMRQPRDLEKLIDLAEFHGSLFASVHGAKDLNDSDDRHYLRGQVNAACKSSDDTSRRTKNRNTRLRERGRLTGGPRAFGFPGVDRTATPDDDGHRPRVAAATVAAERAAILDASKRVAAKVELAKIAADWNVAGLRTATGIEWEAITVRQVLSRGRNAGRLEHEGKVIGRVVGEEPIVDDELFARVQAVFAARRRGRAASGRYLASRLIFCAECGNGLTGRPHGKQGRYERQRAYICEKSPRGGCNKIFIHVDGVDEVLRRFVIGRLSDPKLAERLSKIAREHAQRTEAIASELAEIDTLRRALSDRLGRREIKLDAYDAVCAPLAADEAKLLAELATLEATDDPQLREVRHEAHRDEITAEWDAPDADRRAMLETALRGYRVQVKPHGKYAARRFDPRRVEIMKAG